MTTPPRFYSVVPATTLPPSPCTTSACDNATPPAAQYDTIAQMWDYLANELDETRTPEDAARIEAAMNALRTPPATQGEPVLWAVTHNGSPQAHLCFRDSGDARPCRAMHNDECETEAYDGIIPLYAAPVRVTEAAARLLNVLEAKALELDAKLGGGDQSDALAAYHFAEGVAMLMDALAATKGVGE